MPYIRPEQYTIASRHDGWLSFGMLLAARRGAFSLYRSFSTAHELLGLSPGASALELRRAFLKRALEVHPDLASEPDKAARHEAFRAITNAFEEVGPAVWPSPTICLSG